MLAFFPAKGAAENGFFAADGAALHAAAQQVDEGAAQGVAAWPAAAAFKWHMPCLLLL
jgi:hypothetical protein